MTRRARAMLLGAVLTVAFPAAPAAATDDPGGDIAVSVTIPQPAATPTDPSVPGQRTEFSDAMLTWGLNPETRGKSYYGACNFLMAGWPGAAGDTGAAREWGPGAWGKALYHAESGDARVVSARGGTVAFERRCLDSSGRPVTYNPAQQSASTYTDTQIQLTGGTGWRDPVSGAARIAWQATFTVVYYDGLTYFWLKDPVLTVTSGGAATLTATAGGYGSPREGGAWKRHPDTPVVLATAGAAASAGAREGVTVSSKGLTLKHAYAGRRVTTPDDAPAQRLGLESTAPGAWDQSFVDFHGRTGLHSYWYSSGAAIDHRKPPDPVYVSWDADSPVDAPVNVATPGTAGGVGSLASLTKAVSRPGGGQGGAGTSTDVADPWGVLVTPVAVAKVPKDLVPERIAGAGASIAAQAAILTLLVSASVALIAWRRGWFRLQPKGIIP